MAHTTPPPMPEHQPSAPPPAKRNRTNAIIIGSAAAVIAAIVTTGVVVANSRDDGQSASSPTVSKATGAPKPTHTPSPAKERQAFKVGDTAEIKATDTDFTAAVLAFKDEGINGGPGLLSAGEKWAIVEAKVCNKGAEGFAVSPFVWSLAYTDGARVEPTHISGSELPQPLYPMDAKVNAGDCIRGNITFQVPKEGRPERVLYSPDDVDEPVEWAITK